MGVHGGKTGRQGRQNGVLERRKGKGDEEEVEEEKKQSRRAWQKRDKG